MYIHYYEKGIASYNQVQCTTVTGMNCLQSVTYGSSFYITFYLSRLITLLLSGDIELNPGPMIEKGLYNNDYLYISIIVYQ